MLAELVVPRRTLPNDIEPGVTDICARAPVPVSKIVFVPAASPAVTVIDADLEPVPVGLNETDIEQLPPVGTDKPQSFVTTNWPGFAPDLAIERIGNATVPTLLRAIVLDGDARLSA
jgi:hypothetical protein